MTKQDVYVEANTAQSLAAQASSRGKTLYSFTNEVLDVALRVFGQGGNENEIFPAWKTSRLSKDVGGAPFLPGSLIWKMVERLYRSDPDWLLGEWAAAGRRLGERLRALHPTLEDLQAGLSGLQSLIAEQRIEVQRKPGGKEGGAAIQLRVVTDLTPELAACGERFLEGLLSAYSFEVTENRVKEGTIDIAATYRPERSADKAARGPGPRSHPRQSGRHPSRSRNGGRVHR
jgi:hypothetical protein